MKLSTEDVIMLWNYSSLQELIDVSLAQVLDIFLVNFLRAKEWNKQQETYSESWI